jgi:hypothetical protein
MSGLGKKVWEGSFVKLGLSDHSSLEEFLAGAVERSVEKGKERQSILGENLLVKVRDCSSDAYALEDGFGSSHGGML